MLPLLLRFIPLGFSTVYIESSSWAWLRCKEPGSGSRVTGGSAHLGQGHVSSHQKERLGGQGESEDSQGRSPPGSRLLESQDSAVREGGVLTQGLESGKPLEAAGASREMGREQGGEGRGRVGKGVESRS